MAKTTNYDLEKPTIGSVGWGADVNANFDTIDSQLKTNADAITTKADALGSDENYVTDAQLVIIGNTSGTNTGDETATTIKTKLSITTLTGSNTGDQTLPVKATGAELDNGTDDAKFATAKALVDSSYAKTTDIPAFASKAEAEAGEDNIKGMTPLRTAEAIEAQVIQNGVILAIIDGGGSAITTGKKIHIEVPFACTLNRYTMIADQAGAIVIDVNRSTYADFPTTASICGSGKECTIAATNQKSQDVDIADWTSVAVAAGDILEFEVDSCTTITRVTLSLKFTRT